MKTLILRRLSGQKQNVLSRFLMFFFVYFPNHFIKVRGKQQLAM